MKNYSQQKKILIIKFGGLGDVILSLQAMSSIIQHHKLKKVLLTEKPYDDFFRYSKWFDQIITMKRSLFYFQDLFQIKRKFNATFFSHVYDLQTSKRSSYYLKFFKSYDSITNGIGKYAKICHDDPKRNNLHTIHRQKNQISLSKIKYVRDIKIDWMFNSEISIPKKKFALIVPGGSKKRKNKRIPLEIFYGIIDFLLMKRFKVLVIGSKDDAEICCKIKEKFSEVENLCNRTTLFDLAKLSKFASLSIGNDTGPMHLISKGNKNTFVFFTKFSSPKLCRPVGENVNIFSFKKDKKIFFLEVLAKIKTLL
ncbi:MAG: glycosyltransferase family 9 protein [Alphaproteobacteria bacterium]